MTIIPTAIEILITTMIMISLEDAVLKGFDLGISLGTVSVWGPNQIAPVVRWAGYYYLGPALNS